MTAVVVTTAAENTSNVYNGQQNTRPCTRLINSYNGRFVINGWPLLIDAICSVYCCAVVYITAAGADSLSAYVPGGV